MNTKAKKDFSVAFLLRDHHHQHDCDESYSSKSSSPHWNTTSTSSSSSDSTNSRTAATCWISGKRPSLTASSGVHWNARSRLSRYQDVSTTQAQTRPQAAHPVQYESAACSGEEIPRTTLPLDHRTSRILPFLESHRNPSEGRQRLSDSPCLRTSRLDLVSESSSEREASVRSRTGPVSFHAFERATGQRIRNELVLLSVRLNEC